MSDLPIPVYRVDLGISDGLHRWEVRLAETDEVIGYDEESVPENLS